jgi:polygalacturonase
MLRSSCKKRFTVSIFGSIFLTLPSYAPNYAMAASSGRQLFNIADYGAKKDGSVPATDAFRRAIQAAKAAGGGTVYVPAGKYTSGPIELSSNMNLDIDAGTTIEFPVASLPFTKSRYLGVETLAPMPLIGATMWKMSR